MNSVKRLKESSQVLRAPPSPSGTATTSASSPAAQSDNTEAGPSGTGSIPWYRGSRQTQSGRKPNNKHGYEPFRFSVQKEGDLRLSECVAFWPFTSPMDQEMANMEWDEMEGVFAVAVYGRIKVGRVTDDGYEELWTYQTLGEDHYHVAWSYDPITLRPILASGGSSKVIWLFDHKQGGPTRILRGHGQEIYSIAFHPLHPHILASACADRTIRIWNIYGTDVQLEEGDIEPLSENFAQGDADEGSYLVAVLAGDKAGHKAGVTALAFHPYHNAIASGGYDVQVKIWPLPIIPPPDPTMPPTRRGYRPEIISMPLFSTDRIHKFPIDNIEWLNKDMLVSRAGEEITGWKWLCYKDHFRPGEMEPFKKIGRPHDMISSHSYSITLDIIEDPVDWYWRMGTHLAFNPTENEDDLETVDLVLDTIFVYPVVGWPAKLNLINPFHWEPGPDPTLDHDYRRSQTPDLDGAPIVVQHGLGSELMAIKLEDNSDNEMEEDVEMAEEDDLQSRSGGDSGHDNLLDPVSFGRNGRGEAPTRKRKIDDLISVDSEDEEPDFEIIPTPVSLPAPTPSDAPPKPDHNSDSQHPWQLILGKKELEKAVNATKLTKKNKTYLLRSKMLLNCVAVSPRGAKWVVAVGQGEAVAIWRLKDKPGG